MLLQQGLCPNPDEEVTAFFMLLLAGNWGPICGREIMKRETRNKWEAKKDKERKGKKRGRRESKKYGREGKSLEKTRKGKEGERCEDPWLTIPLLPTAEPWQVAMPLMGSIKSFLPHTVTICAMYFVSCLVSAETQHAECRSRVSVVIDGVDCSLLPYIRRRVPLHQRQAWGQGHRP